MSSGSPFGAGLPLGVGVGLAPGLVLGFAVGLATALAVGFAVGGSGFSLDATLGDALAAGGVSIFGVTTAGSFGVSIFGSAGAAGTMSEVGSDRVASLYATPLPMPSTSTSAAAMIGQRDRERAGAPIAVVEESCVAMGPVALPATGFDGFDAGVSCAGVMSGKSEASEIDWDGFSESIGRSIQAE